MGIQRTARVERSAHRPCAFCDLPTRVKITVKAHDRPGEPEASRRICVACFKAIIEHLTRPDPNA